MAKYLNKLYFNTLFKFLNKKSIHMHIDQYIANKL
jgi:hypothetical protein